MDRSIIEQVQSYGFDVYMRNERDTYMIFTDGQHLGYLQVDRMSGYTLRTVHKPNSQTGTGYQVERFIGEINKEMLKACFVHVPQWASSRDREGVKKYRDIEDYRKSSQFNAEYKLVPKALEEA